MHACNTKLWKPLGIGTINDKGILYFQHPTNDKIKIHIFADVPHLMKLARNHLLDLYFEFDHSKTSKD